jgi:aerotolerance regulator-like protein
MFELFLNPANMVIGGALVSSPIIIHLINRMRFRRVRWAAMEFLLKSQKRNRRRLIIEQLILLALRILLVLLAGLLLARFLGFSFAGIFQPQNTVHIVILDDRLSMTDHWKSEEGDVKNSFQVAKQLIEKEIARPATQGRSANRLVVLRLSDPSEPFDQRLNEESLRDLNAYLGRMDQCSLMHLDMTRGLKAAEDIFEKNPQDQGILYIVSDFRQRHWSGPEAEGLLKALDQLSKGSDKLAKNKVRINLIDTAHPFRSETQRTAMYHDNLAVVELRPETRVAAEGMPVQFTVTVANYSASERKNVRVTIKVDGLERSEGSLTMLSVPPGTTSATFIVSLVRLGFNQITANLENEEAGLQADNTRYAVVEVRRQVPVLIIDGDLTNGDKPGGDTFHLKTLFTAARGFEVQRGGVNELRRSDLEKYPSIYLLNVPELDERAVKSLENYVRGGGSVAFFMGPRVRPDFYNQKLYRDGKGLFPVILADRPSKEFTPEEKQQRMLANLLDPQFQIFLRSDTHPLFAEAYKFRTAFKFLNLERYYPVPRQKWNRETNHAEELATLPNDRPVADYEAGIRELLNALPLDDPKYAKYRPGLERQKNAVRDKLLGKALFSVANALDGLLRDPGKAGDPDQPNLREFWELTDSKIQDLKNRLEKLKEAVQYGDPLVVTSRFGKGRVVAFLTTAGRAWNDWAGGSPASVTYPVVMLELQKFLSSVDMEGDKTVGTALDIELDSTRYEQKMHRYFQPEAREGDAAQPAQPADNSDPHAGLKDLGEQVGSISSGRLLLSFDEARKPGIYIFELMQRPDEGVEARMESRAVAYNVDTTNESDLRRASRDDLEHAGSGVLVHRPDSGTLREQIANRQTDLSESPWFYLLFLIVLVIEQALAVHLSFHLRGNEALPPAQAVQPQATAA